MKKCHSTDRTKQKRYYATQDRNGTEDEIIIRTPEGREMAFIWFWDSPESTDAATAKADARLIADALNSYRRRKKKSPGEKAKAAVDANLRKPSPRATVYKQATV